MMRFQFIRRQCERRTRIPALALAALLCLLMQGCLFTFKADPRINRAAFERNPPVRVAVLPFENRSDVPEAVIQARASFYNALSSKSYEDVELGRVDDALARAALDTGSDPMLLPPHALAEYIKTDALLYGVIHDVSKFYIILSTL